MVGFFMAWSHGTILHPLVNSVAQDDILLRKSTGKKVGIGKGNYDNKNKTGWSSIVSSSRDGLVDVDRVRFQRIKFFINT